MGCFDTIIIKCPICGYDVHFQSKAHVCILRKYNIINAPIEIKEDLDRRKEICPKCNASVGVKKRVIWDISVE